MSHRIFSILAGSLIGAAALGFAAPSSADEVADFYITFLQNTIEGSAHRHVCYIEFGAGEFGSCGLKLRQCLGQRPEPVSGVLHLGGLIEICRRSGHHPERWREAPPLEAFEQAG